jgi:hypothetical protein
MEALNAGIKQRHGYDHLKRLESNVNTSTTIEGDESDIDDMESSFEMEVEVENDESKKRKGRPKENDSEREVSLAYEIKKLRKKEKYNKEKQLITNMNLDFDVDVSDENLTITNKSNALISLIDKSGSYHQNINGKQNSLSITTGLFAQQMYSEGISQNKLPNLVAAVVNMLVGLLTTQKSCHVLNSWTM